MKAVTPVHYHDDVDADARDDAGDMGVVLGGREAFRNAVRERRERLDVARLRNAEARLRLSQVRVGIDILKFVGRIVRAFR